MATTTTTIEGLVNEATTPPSNGVFAFDDVDAKLSYKITAANLRAWMRDGILLADGSIALTDDLDLGGNDIVNVGLVDGVDVSAHAARHILGGADEIDGDQIGISWDPSTYTPTLVAEAGQVDHLTAHLAGIDAYIGGIAASQVANDSFVSGVNVDDALDALDTAKANSSDVLLLDGSQAMTGGLDMGGNAVSNIGAFGISVTSSGLQMSGRLIEDIGFRASFQPGAKGEWYNVGSNGATDFERGNIFWGADVWQITTSAGGTGVARDILIGASGSPVSILTAGGIELHSNSPVVRFGGASESITLQDDAFNFLIGSSPELKVSASEIDARGNDITGVGGTLVADADLQIQAQGGTEVLRVEHLSGAAWSRVLLPDSTAAKPGASFFGDPERNTGLYGGNDVVGLAVDGAKAIEASDAGLDFGGLDVTNVGFVDSRMPVETISTNKTLANADNGKFVVVDTDTAGGDVTITVPDGLDNIVVHFGKLGTGGNVLFAAGGTLNPLHGDTTLADEDAMAAVVIQSSSDAWVTGKLST